MLRRLLRMLGVLKDNVDATKAGLAELNQRTQRDVDRLKQQTEENQRAVRAFEAELEVYRHRHLGPS